jgi:3'(2'), 5'-bisphosphate nucleotidase
MTDLHQRYETAAAAARAAGEAAMHFYGTADSAAKSDGSPVSQADHAANHVIVERLRADFPEDAILSEESRDSAERLSAARVWIVDPLDGTKEFLACNGEFSIMIGLVENGEPVLGVVYLADGDVLFGAIRGEGAWVEQGGTRTPLSREDLDGAPLRLVGSRSHSDPLLSAMQEQLGITDVAPCGSVGVKCSRIATGQRDLYVHPVPYLKEWDTCAPEIILREAGGWVSDCYGNPLEYNKPDPRQPHGIVAAAPGCRERVLSVVTPVYEASLSGAGAP